MNMANKKLNEVTTVSSANISNVKTFLAVMNDGSIQQMSKEDMASVLGELQGIHCITTKVSDKDGAFILANTIAGIVLAIDKDNTNNLLVYCYSFKHGIASKITT